MDCENTAVDFLMIDELMSKKIGEIDLAVLGRTYRLIKMYFETPVELLNQEGQSSSLRNRFTEHILCEGPYSTERTLALMIVFEEHMKEPAYLKRVERTLNKVFGIENEG